MMPKGAERRASGDDAAVAAPSGFVLGLLLGEFRGSLVFPYPAVGGKSSLEGSVVGDCRKMLAWTDSHASEPLEALNERLKSWLRSLQPRPTVPVVAYDDVVRACRWLSLSRLHLASVSAEVEDSGVTSRRAVGLARLSAAVYALEASTIEAAGWLDRGGFGPGPETSFLDALTDRVVDHTLLDARWRGMPFGRVSLERSAFSWPASAWGLAVVSRRAPKSWKGLAAEIGRRLARSASPPSAPTATPMLRPFGDALCRRASALGRAVEGAFAEHGQSVLADDRLVGRLDAAAVELASSACVLARLDASASADPADPEEQVLAELYLHESGRRCDEALRALAFARDPDREALEVGRRLLRRRSGL